jgi:hypothetical protein
MRTFALALMGILLVALGLSMTSCVLEPTPVVCQASIQRAPSMASRYGCYPGAALRIAEHKGIAYVICDCPVGVTPPPEPEVVTVYAPCDEPSDWVTAPIVKYPAEEVPHE